MNVVSIFYFAAFSFKYHNNSCNSKPLRLREEENMGERERNK